VGLSPANFSHPLWKRAVFLLVPDVVHLGKDNGGDAGGGSEKGGEQKAGVHRVGVLWLGVVSDPVQGSRHATGQHVADEDVKDASALVEVPGEISGFVGHPESQKGR